MRHISLCLISVLGAASVMPLHAREWTDASGRYKFEAELISAGPDSVRLLLNENNTQYDIPLDLLSKADRDFVKQRAGSVGRGKSRVTSVPSSVMRSIRENAKREWPGNYRMQKHEIDSQQAGYLAVANYSDPFIPSDILTRIMASAKTEWAENYRMQKHEIDSQVKGYRAVKAYRAAGIPSDVLSQIVQKAVREWPGNYRMQKHEIDNQVEAYKQLH